MMADNLLNIKVKVDSSQLKSQIPKISSDADQASRKIGGLGGVFSSLKSPISSFTGSVTNSFGSIGSGLGGLLKMVGPAGFIVGGVTAAAAAIGSALGPIRKFQTEMANVESLGVSNINSLKASVLSLSEEVSVPLSSLSKGLYDVVSAGVASGDQMTVLESSAKAAKAGLAQTSEALGLGSAVIKGYGKDWTEFNGVMDMAFKTVALGQTTFPQLAGSLGQVVPIAASLKIKTEELFGGFATLTGVTGNTSEVATQLRGVMQGLADPTEKMAQLATAAGYATVEQMVAEKGLGGVMEMLGAVTGGSASEMTQYFGSIEAVTAALALSGSQSDAFIEKTVSMKNATGEMTKAYDIQNATLDSQIDLLKNRWGSTWQQILGLVVPLVTEIVSGLSFVMKGITSAVRGVLDLGAKVDRFITDKMPWLAKIAGIKAPAEQAAAAVSTLNDTITDNQTDEVTGDYQKIIDKLKQMAEAAKNANSNNVNTNLTPTPGNDSRPSITPKTFVTPITMASATVQESDQFDPVEEANKLLALNEAMHAAGAESDADFYRTKIDLARQSYDEMVALYGAESLQAYQAAAEKKAAEKDYIDYKTSINSQAVSAIGQLITGLFGQSKAGATASAIINTYEAATKALAGSAPPWNLIAMAGVIGTGLAQVKKINETNVEKRALGGDVLSDMPYLVGELGPELIVPRRSGTVIPNSAFESGSGMTGILDRMDSMVRAVKNIKLEVHSELDAIKFYRNTFPEYQETEAARTI